MPAKKTKESLPGTLQRSPKKAQDTYADTLASAHETYQGDEERAHRTAFAAVKHSFESGARPADVRRRRRRRSHES